MKLAIVFEESWAYEYKERKKAERGSDGRGVETGGASTGFEEIFSFGEDDDSDYWDRPDITEGIPIPD